MRRQRSPWRRWIAVGIGCALLLVAGLALARVGGGGSYGGGGSSGGGGGGDGDLIVWLLYLAIRHPVVGVPLLIIVGVGWYLKRRHQQRHALPASTQQSIARQRSGAVARQRAQVIEQLERLVEDDPNFSEILFLDFAQMIYTRTVEARGGRGLEGLRPYLAPEIAERLDKMGAALGQGSVEVEDVVVGSLTIQGVLEQANHWQLACEVEANYTEISQLDDQPARSQAYFVRSRMLFRRLKGALSKGPDQIKTLGCPSCGSPMKFDAENLCAYCGQPPQPGLFHWELLQLGEGIRLKRHEAPLQLGGQEVGTDAPTVFDPDLDVATKAFLMRNPGTSLEHLHQRARDVFAALQAAWTSGSWEQARAFETDRLFQIHTFWMDRYRQRGLTNRLEQVQVLDTSLVKIGRDAFFEFATLRIKASMLDYVVDKHGNLMGGSKDRPRVFSEYWTFIRQAGFDPGKEAATSSCPSCGAPVKVAMNGRCEYCDANLVSGEFDWTLAKIEQDEAYAG